MSQETPPSPAGRTSGAGPAKGGPAPVSVFASQAGLFRPDDPLRAAFAAGATFWRAPVAVESLGTAGGDARLARKNADLLDMAVLRLSQSDTGRDLLTQLSAAGYAIVFDDAATAARGASGLCEVQTKRLILKSCDDADALALLLAHEGVHALQAERADDLLPSSRHRPETVFRLSFAIEADAYAQQIQTAFELARGNPSFARPLLLMRGRFPALVRAADRALQRAAASDGDGGAAALADGRVCAAVFNAFYDDAGLRSYYERAHLDWLKAVAASEDAQPQGHAAKSFNGKSRLNALFRRDMTGARLRGLLLWRGQAYLERHRPDIDFTQPRHAGLGEQARATVLDFYRQCLPGRKLPEISTFGLSAVAAFADPSVPPANPRDLRQHSAIKAPRKRKRDFW